MPISFAEGRGSSVGMGTFLDLLAADHRRRHHARSMTQQQVMNDRIGVLIAVLSSAFGGTAAAVTRYVVGAIDPVTIAAFRFGIGFLVLLPLALLLRSALPRGRDWLGVGLL